MTNAQMADILVSKAKRYAPGAVESVKRNAHMNEYRGPALDQKVVDAVLVDFINFIMGQSGMDLALYTCDLKPEISPDVGHSK